MKAYGLVLLISVFCYSITLCQSSIVKIGSKKAWIENVDFDKNTNPPTGQESSYYYLLLDEQENTSSQESFVHYAYKMLTSEGLQQMSDLSVDFDPSYEQVTFHSILIHRNGTTISKLPKAIRTIQREQSMDRYLYDESQTAIINLTDVRVGDIIEYSYTRKGYNPVYDGHISRRMTFNYSIAFEKGFQRLIVPITRNLFFRNLNTEIQYHKEEKNGLIYYTWTSQKVNALLTDNYEPDWYNPYAYVYVSSFKNWAEVAAWANKRYTISDQDKVTVLKEIVPHFKTTSQEEYVLQAIRFVQDEVRYLGFESGLNSHKPHSPIQVYNQRFGDCKDKSLLLTTMLNAKGIEAYPLLVNTIYRDKLSYQLPLTNSFNHCVVQLILNDKVYYIDPTIGSQGGDLNHYYFPLYGKGLVVSAATTDLIDLPKSETPTISEVQTFNVDSVGGAGMLMMETVYTGYEADAQRSYYSNNNLESIQKNYLTFYGNTYPDIEKKELLQIEDDRQANIFKVKESYTIPSFWKKDEKEEGKIYCDFYNQTLQTYFNVSKSAQRTSPYRLTYPLNYSHEIHVNLPEDWSVTLDHTTIERDFYYYDYEVKYDNRRFSRLTTYKTKKESVPVDAFSQFVADHEKMLANLGYSLTYSKKQEQAQDSVLPGIILTIITFVLGIGFMIWLYKKYDPRPDYQGIQETPIGGWLVLVAIGLSITPVQLIYSFVMENYILDGRGWMSMWYAKNYGSFLFLVLEHIYNVVYLLFSVLVAILFFQKRSSVPVLISFFYGGSCLVNILDSWFIYTIDPNQVDTKEMIRGIIMAAIWIPYFHLSTRVKETFVNGYFENNDRDSEQPALA
jgi:Domain of Unknown Function with PDB structure (DUF3857)/Protein of unknown function (DUF2569)